MKDVKLPARFRENFSYLMAFFQIREIIGNEDSNPPNFALLVILENLSLTLSALPFGPKKLKPQDFSSLAGFDPKAMETSSFAIFPPADGEESSIQEHHVVLFYRGLSRQPLTFSAVTSTRWEMLWGE
jgi:hypothetical protein